MNKPLAIDLFCGLFGWSEGLVAEGYRVIGVDIEDMCGQFGMQRPAECSLLIQDVLTLHGSQFKDAALIVASPPCQQYSYMAMPWTKAKAKAAAIRADMTGESLERLNRLFMACFRIQREAIEAAGHHIPLIVENVRGANPWVDRSRWSYGSFHLWGDVPALMPISIQGRKNAGGSWFAIGSPGQQVLGQNPVHALAAEGRKGAGPRWGPETKLGAYGMKRWTNPVEGSGIKCGGDWFGDNNPSALRLHSSKSYERKMASALIAKIPLPLSQHIAAVYRP